MRNVIYPTKNTLRNIRKCCSFVLFLAVLLSFSSCLKITKVVGSKTNLTESEVYNNNLSAISVLTGLYQTLNQEGYLSGPNSMSLMFGLAADEFNLSEDISQTDPQNFHYIDSLFSNNTSEQGTQFWRPFYNYIFVCNSAIEGLNKSTGLTPAVKNQLLGEAKFLRAFFHFYLTNIYGDIPIAVTTDWKDNSKLIRSQVSEVYQQVITDLTESESLLSNNFLDGSLQAYIGKEERVRPTKWVAIALLARVYLYAGNWAKAESKASLLIDNNTLFSIQPLDQVFLKNNKEAIWELQPIDFGRNTQDGFLFLLDGPPSFDHPVSLSDDLLKSFEQNDQRRFNRKWIDSVYAPSLGMYYYFPFKYKYGAGDISSVDDLSEYLLVFRLGEQYLIRAEARARLLNLDGANEDIRMIRFRANLGYNNINDQTQLIKAVLEERRRELFSEWGHRWFDLKRTGLIDSVMSIARPKKKVGTIWSSFRQLNPLPFNEILKNVNLKQNKGYEQ